MISNDRGDRGQTRVRGQTTPTGLTSPLRLTTAGGLTKIIVIKIGINGIFAQIGYLNSRHLYFLK
jgi:hypothetical protein